MLSVGSIAGAAATMSSSYGTGKSGPQAQTLAVNILEVTINNMKQQPPVQPAARILNRFV